MEFSTWLTFFLATVAISAAPGPGAIAAMGAGLNHGFRQGQPLAVGLALGVCTQLAVIAIGLGALLASSETAFTVVKWAGALYLVWLGIQQWRSPVSPIQAPQSAEPLDARQRLRALLLRGWTVNALNPKGTVFLLAVMPQFLDVSRPLLAQYLTIGVTFGIVECSVMTGYVALAARVLGFLRSPQHIRALNRSFGGLFVLAGGVLAMFKRSV
jgi:homoserine/homoserine lactone efflux protein